MRILHIDSGREMRGGQWQVWYLLRGLRSRGHDVRLLARLGGALLGRAAAAGFDAMPLNISALLRSHRWAEVVHAHDARSHAKAALLFGGRLVVSRRVAFPVRKGWLSAWKYRRAAHYIAISRCVADQLLQAGLPSDAISVVYDGVPLEPEPPASGGRLVIAPATSDPMKGADLALQGACAAGIDLVFSDNLAGDLGRAAVFVYATRSEGLGSAALLAMARAVPVVASRVGGLVEVVENGVSGLLVDNTAEDIGRAIRLLLENDELRLRLGRAGRERVKRHFSLDSMVDGTVRVYEKVHA